MTLPRISIVTSSFNQGTFLEECIDSVLSQNYPDLEYIIIDGGSTDTSVDIIRKYERHLAYWVSEPDKGQSHALNKGFARATGEVMAYINSDDKYFPWTLKTVGGLFRDFDEVEWLTSICYLCWNSEGDPIPGSYFPGFRRRDFYQGRTLGNSNDFLGWIQQESTFWRKSLWEKTGSHIAETLHYAMDFEMWARFYEHAYLFGVAMPLGGYRFQTKQKTASGINNYYEEAASILAEHNNRRMPEMNDHLLKTLKYNYGTQSWFVETDAEQAEQTNAQLREWAERAEQTNAQLREWIEKAQEQVAREQENTRQMRQWAERNEQILLEERDRITLLEIELSSLRAFTGRVKWLYQIFLRLNRGA